MKRYKTKFEEVEATYTYYKYLKEINDIMYSRDIVKNDEYDFQLMNFTKRVDEEKLLTEAQKKYLNIKAVSADDIYSLLDNGYIFIWKLNNNQRVNSSLYHRAYFYIRSLEWGERKVYLIKKMFNLIIKEKSFSKHRKEAHIFYLFHEIKKQAEVENHPERDLLYGIDKYEDMCDLLDVFLNG